NAGHGRARTIAGAAGRSSSFDVSQDFLIFSRAASRRGRHRSTASRACAMLVLTVVGARPQFVKAAVVSSAIRERGIEELIVHTGQHWDARLSDVFFSELGLPPPDRHLGISSLGHGAMTGRMLESLEKVTEDTRPDVVLVHGDTNSTLAGALAAAKLHVPVAHVEAGMRSYDRRMPEELNRVLTDHLSRFLFCTSEAPVELLA